MIWSHFAEEASAAIDFYKGDKPAKLITAVRNAARTNGAILDWINTQHKVSTSSHDCLSGGDNTVTNLVDKDTAMASAAPNCVASWAEVTANNAGAATVSAQGITGVLGTAVPHGTLANTDKKCNSNSGHTAIKLLNDATGTNVGPAEPKLVAGIFKLTDNGIATEGLRNVDENKKTTHPYVYHIVQAVKTSEETITLEDVSTLDKAKTSNSFKGVARVHLLGTKETDGSRDTEVPDKIQTAFGSPEEYTAIYSRNVDEMPLTKELTHDPNLRKLGEITDINDLMRLYFFFSDRLKSQVKDMTGQLEEAKRQQAPKSAKEKEKECHTKGKDKQEECEKLESQGCVFNESGKDGAKCTLKKEVKAELEKANQETGGKTEEKCAKHGTDKNACDKDSNCKWENNACKDFSFLVIKKFTLFLATFLSLLAFYNFNFFR
uniref:Variant surface glycoprotein 1125.4884 n=1 Tax=Trypanosoma brucei TaxID=5691 RepID=A0A1J0RB57_9TRYP|nr:variant surface glycoprotein 1125.4884 [Trypanosoma brucei]